MIRSAWSRISARKYGRLYVAGAGLVVVALAGVALRVPPAIADAQKIEGKPVPDAELSSVVAAATACPTLTPARLAGQLMALTGFDTAVSGPSIAGVSDAMWSKWKPAANAERDDEQANIVALAHQDCELVGELRVAGIPGDQFQLAVAAQHGGISAVTSAKGVPGGQKDFVDQVSGYAAWYADTDQFNVQGAPSPAPSSSSGSADPSSSAAPDSAAASLVPADLVSAVKQAGTTCRDVTPARIAAQLKAASNFDANLRTTTGQGIAQFSTTMWAAYAGKKQSVWNAADAIGVLGEAMCDLTNQFSGFTGTDSWQMALGAFQWGVVTVRQAGGLPKSTVPQLATTAEQYLPAFEAELDTKATPSASPSASPSPSASRSPSASPSPSVSPTPAPLYDPAKTYQIQNGWAGAILELPGDDFTDTPAGTRVQLWNNLHGKDQYWTIKPAAADGYVIITNKLMNMSISYETESSAAGNLTIKATDPADTTEQWSIADAGDGKVWFTNHQTGKVMDLFGDDQTPPNSDGTWNGAPIGQWDHQADAKDQRWVLMPS